jgi:hypothetical protein
MSAPVCEFRCVREESGKHLLQSRGISVYPYGIVRHRHVQRLTRMFDGGHDDRDRPVKNAVQRHAFAAPITSRLTRRVTGGGWTTGVHRFELAGFASARPPFEDRRRNRADSSRLVLTGDTNKA